MFGIEAPPLLNDGDHYSNYWLERGVHEVVAIRSPIVHHSEVNVLNFKNNADTRNWYKHITSGIIYPANGVGVDCIIHGGSDYDGDIVCTINNRTMIDARIPGLPIIYESMKSQKKEIDSRNDAEQVESQLKGYNSKVGYATNVSSTLYCMLTDFAPGSPEREAILNRLKIGRVIQGEIIDGVKGLDVPPFREHWVKWKNPKKVESKLRKAQRFNNSIVAEKRPAFFRF